MAFLLVVVTITISTGIFVYLNNKISLLSLSILIIGLDIITISVCIITSYKLFSYRGLEFFKKRKIRFNKTSFLSSIYMILGYILIKCVIVSFVKTHVDIETTNKISQTFINTYLEGNKVVGSILICIQMIIIGPIVEELLFRGILLRSLLEKFYKNPFKAIIYTSLVFGVLHLNLMQGIISFGGGIILGIIYYYTKSIKLCMLTHILNNLLIIIPSPISIIIKILYIIIGIVLIKAGLNRLKVQFENT